MRATRGVASLALLPLILIACMLGFGVQTAGAVSLDQVTGGQSGLFVPLTNVQQLGQKGIFVSPISPAYLTFTLQEGPAVRFPITGGAVGLSSSSVKTRPSCGETPSSGKKSDVIDSP